MMRALAAALALALALPAAGTQAVERERWPLWPAETPVEAGGPAGPDPMQITERGDAAGLRDRYASAIRAPDITAFPAARPSGCALLSLPGGGYERVVMDKEGYESAEWFAARGISVFVVRYRLPGEYTVPRPELPLADAQRALRLVRGRAAEYGIDPGCVGVIGFSAGGHLAGLLATAAANAYEPLDEVDSHSASPAFAVLVYPVVSMRAEIAHPGSRARLLGASPEPAALVAHSIEERVAPNTPPVFLLHAADDEAVDVEHTFALHRALRAAGVPTELHVYASGGHGFGLRGVTGKPAAAWPSLVLRWLGSIDPRADAR